MDESYDELRREVRRLSMHVSLLTVCVKLLEEDARESKQTSHLSNRVILQI